MKIRKINKQSIAISGFTSVLETLHTPPNQLYIAGRLPANRVPTVAIVGSRKPTAYGIEVTERIASDLAKAGVVVVSGLAFGVDAIAHKAALDANGTTIAVLANGLHKIYPVSHRALGEQILKQGGAIVSEQAPGVEAMKYHFLSRNRIISGLADAILVTEATDRSGTASTVNHAIEQNKEVFAVPGPITSLLSAGPNRLLQQGAHVALSAKDILAVIAPKLVQTQTTLALGYTELENKIIQCIQKGIRSGEDLQAASGESPRNFLQALTMLELAGTIKNLGANQWALS